jgi:hypothetical protein
MEASAPAGTEMIHGNEEAALARGQKKAGVFGAGLDSW